MFHRISYSLGTSMLTVSKPVAKKIAIAAGVADFNILQNNGRIAHQVVDHVSFYDWTSNRYNC